MISPDYIWSQKDKSDDEKDQIPPIEAILSSSFMANEGWVLDFGAQIIYKKKSCFLLDVNECATKVNDACHLRFFMDATKIGMPLIQITEGDFKGMVLLIDSGSSDNVIFEKAYREMRDKFERKDEVSRLMGMEGNPVEARIVKTRINICGKDYSMQFLVNNNNQATELLRKSMGFGIAGMIGTTFMAEHDWTINFAKQEIILPAADVADPDVIRKKTA